MLTKSLEMDERLNDILDNLTMHYVENPDVPHHKLAAARLAVYDFFEITEEGYLEHLEARLDKLFVEKG